MDNTEIYHEQEQEKQTQYDTILYDWWAKAIDSTR